MPLHVSSSVKLKRVKSREYLSKCFNYEDKIQKEEKGDSTCNSPSAQENGDRTEDVTLVFSTVQGTFKFELSEALGR